MKRGKGSGRARWCGVGGVWIRSKRYVVVMTMLCVADDDASVKRRGAREVVSMVGRERRERQREREGRICEGRQHSSSCFLGRLGG